MMRKLYFLTATRAEYDILYPVAKACDALGGLEVGIIATAAHLSPHHGMGIDQIRADGLKIVATIESLISSESWSGRSLSFAHLVEGLTRTLSSDRPDVLIVAGDREEALAGAIVGNFLRIHVAHLFGGDRCIASDVDEVFRPAISKLAHLHFVATEGHRERLIRMGEQQDTIWVTGATGIDRLAAEPDVDDEVLTKRYGIDVGKSFFLIIHHPSPTLDEEIGSSEISSVLEGVLSTGIPAFCSYPNFDPGNVGMRKVIDKYQAGSEGKLVVYHNLPRRDFVALYRRCSAVIGNSSSIVIESPYLKIPGILVGDRQRYRELADNVITVAAKAAEIRAACKRALGDEKFRYRARECTSIYGDGHASSRIARTLSGIDLMPGSLNKRNSY